MESVLVIGAGRMGYGVIRTLLRKGYKVLVNDRSVEAMNRAINCGAVPAHELESAVNQTEFIFLSLPGPQQVYNTINEIVNINNSHGPYIVDLSTIDPQTAKKCQNLCKENGYKYLEAPVSGGPKGAETGSLTIMVGGEEEDFLKVQPLLSVIGKTIYYLGLTGNASLAKICNNIVVATTTAILCEVFILASQGGIEPKKLKEILDNSVGGSRTLDVFGQHFVSGDYSKPTFSLGLMHKDVGLFMEAIRQFDLTSWVGSLTYQIYKGAYAQGWRDEDHTVICKYLETLNNKSIKRTMKEGV